MESVRGIILNEKELGELSVVMGRTYTRAEVIWEDSQPTATAETEKDTEPGAVELAVTDNRSQNVRIRVSGNDFSSVRSLIEGR